MNRIKELLREKGLSEQEFADDISVSRVTVSRWISGTREPSKHTKGVIARALDEKEEYAFCETNRRDGKYIDRDDLKRRLRVMEKKDPAFDLDDVMNVIDACYGKN